MGGINKDCDNAAVLVQLKDSVAKIVINTYMKMDVIDFVTAKNIQSTGLPLPKNITHEQRYVYLSNQKGARSSTDGQLLYSLCHV